MALDIAKFLLGLIAPKKAGAVVRSQTTTWNPADLSNVTLTNTNLTGTVTAIGTAGGVRGTTSKASGKWYWTYTLNNAAWNGTDGLGLMQSVVSLTSQIGGGLTSIGYRPSSGAVRFNGLTIGTAAVAGANAQLDFAIDFGAALVWIRVNGGNWNNNVAADPATGAGGFSFAGFTAGNYFPAFTFSTTVTAGDGAVINMYNTTGVPNGFGKWDQ